MTAADAVQAVYEGMHDSTCLRHGPHCERDAPQIRDAIRVGLQRAGLDTAAAKLDRLRDWAETTERGAAAAEVLALLDGEPRA